jgi:hypothetical protein
MNVARLMEDLLSCLQGQPDKVRANYFDASLALACNLITNTTAGDLADDNLIVSLDQEFLQVLLKRRFGVSALGHDIPLLLQGLHYLRTDGAATLDGNVINLCLLDFYRVALPLGDWDDLLVDADKRHLTAQKLVAQLRPDVGDLVLDDQQRMVWLIKHGFQELPLYRSKLRRYFSDATGNKDFQLQRGDIGYAFQQISSSIPPQDQDLFSQEIGFKRWICVNGAMLIYKKKAFDGRVHDMRWLQRRTTLALRNATLGPEGRVTLSLGALGRAADFKITVHSATEEQQKIVRFENVTALLCEFRVQKWVDTVRITIESTEDYLADLGTT